MENSKQIASPFSLKLGVQKMYSVCCSAFVYNTCKVVSHTCLVFRAWRGYALPSCLGCPKLHTHSWTGSVAVPSEDKLATCMTIWRWLIIDEISMVSAKLLANLDMKLRSTIREKGTAKIDGYGLERPFDGLNVLLVGDF